MGGGISSSRGGNTINGSSSSGSSSSNCSSSNIHCNSVTTTTANNNNNNNNNNNRSSLNIEVSIPTIINSNDSSIVLTPGIGRNSFRQIVSEDNSLTLELATPRLGENDVEQLYTSVPFTPLVQDINDSNNLYSYYCPLCMEYFGKILKSGCCSNYTCLSCSISYLGTKGIVINTANELLKLGKNKLNNIACPHCFRNEYQIELVLPTDNIRDYRNIQKSSIKSSDNGGNSPLKAGDSFENMKRKMKRYNDSSNNIITITEQKDEDDIDIILRKCHSITFVDDDNTENDISKYEQNYITNVSNELTSNIIKNIVSKKYTIGV